jgi:hypothetical protein
MPVVKAISMTMPRLNVASGVERSGMGLDAGIGCFNNSAKKLQQIMPEFNDRTVIKRAKSI